MFKMIRTKRKKILHKNFAEKDLATRTTCLKMLIEVFYLAYYIGIP